MTIAVDKECITKYREILLQHVQSILGARLWEGDIGSVSDLVSEYTEGGI